MMEDQLQNFDKPTNVLDQFTEIENRYKTAQGISETLIDQVREDYKTIYSLTAKDEASAERIETLLAHMKEIYPDILGSVEETTDVERDILQSVEELNN